MTHTMPCHLTRSWQTRPASGFLPLACDHQMCQKPRARACLQPHTLHPCCPQAAGMCPLNSDFLFQRHAGHHADTEEKVRPANNWLQQRGAALVSSALGGQSRKSSQTSFWEGCVEEVPLGKRLKGWMQLCWGTERVGAEEPQSDVSNSVYFHLWLISSTFRFLSLKVPWKKEEREGRRKEGRQADWL